MAEWFTVKCPKCGRPLKVQMSFYSDGSGSRSTHARCLGCKTGLICYGENKKVKVKIHG